MGHDSAPGYRRAGWWTGQRLVDRFESHVAEAPDQLALVSGSDTLSSRSLAGGFVFCLVRGHVREGCFHYIWWLGTLGWWLGDGGFVPGAGVDSDGGECLGL